MLRARHEHPNVVICYVCDLGTPLMSVFSQLYVTFFSTVFHLFTIRHYARNRVHNLPVSELFIVLDTSKGYLKNDINSIQQASDFLKFTHKKAIQYVDSIIHVILSVGWK